MNRFLTRLARVPAFLDPRRPRPHGLPQVSPHGVRGPRPCEAREVEYGDTLIGTLRSSYGSRFARGGCTDNEKWSEALAKLDGLSFATGTVFLN
jgi:hypothetical protein